MRARAIQEIDSEREKERDTGQQAHHLVGILSGPRQVGTLIFVFPFAGMVARAHVGSLCAQYNMDSRPPICARDPTKSFRPHAAIVSTEYERVMGYRVQTCICATDI